MFQLTVNCDVVCSGRFFEPRSHEVTKRLLTIQRLLRAFAASWFILLPASAFAASPTSQPDQISTWFADLANKDASVREKARVSLMGISRSDLEKLRELVKSNRPLAPSQVMALREIVDQVYQATEPYDAIEGQPGFLGVPLPPPAIVMDGAEDDAQLGMVVASRIRGFCAARFLQDGDVITDIDGHPVHNSKDLTDIVKNTKGGDTIQVTVQRGGQQVQIPIKLDARPAWAVQAPAGLTQDSLRERQRKADEYWDQAFAPLLDAGLL